MPNDSIPISPKDIQRLIDSEVPKSTAVVRTLGVELRRQVGSGNFYENTAMSSDPQSLNDALTRIVSAYEKRKETLDLGNKILESNHFIIKAALSYPLRGNATHLGKAVGMVANAALGEVERMVEETGRQELRRLLRSQLNEYEGKLGAARLQELIAKKHDAQAFMDELYSQVDASFGPALDKIPAEDRDIVEAFRQKQIANIVTTGFDAVLSIQGVQGQELEKTKKNIVGLSHAFYTYAKQTSERVGILERTQQEIRVGLEKLNLGMQKTERNVAFIQDYLFGKMSPQEQRAMLKAGWFADMTERERETLDSKIELEEKRVELTETLDKYVSGAKDVANIASNLGVDPGIVRTLSTAASVGANLFSAFKAFSSDNFLGGVSAISNLFKIGGRDIATERHAGLMKALNALYGEVQKVRQKLEIIDEKINRLIEGQAAIYESIVLVGEQMARNHADSLNEFRNLRKETLINRELIVDEIFSEYEMGRRFLYERPLDFSSTRMIDVGKGVYPSYSRFVKEYREAKEAFTECWSRVTKLYIDPSKFHSSFYYRNLEKVADVDDQRAAIIMRANEQYGALYTLFEKHHEADPKRLRQLLEAARVPMKTVEFLEKKLRTAETLKTDDVELSLPIHKLRHRLKNLLSVDSIARHCDIVANFHVYHFMIDENETVLPFDDLLDLDPGHQKGLDELEGALDLVDTAIIQYTLLSGDVALPVLYRLFASILDGSLASTAQVAGQTIMALQSNPILAANLVMYGVRSEVAARNAFLAYSAALKSQTPDLLKLVLSSKWPLLNREHVGRGFPDYPLPASGWSVKIGKAIVELPTDIELYDATFRFQPELYKLIELKDLLLDQIVSFEVIRDIQETDRKDHTKFLLNTTRSPSK